MKKALFMGLLVSLGSISAFACNGIEITAQEVKLLPVVKIYQGKFEAATGEKLLLKDIIFSKNNILNYDQAIVASARCMANYINVYFRPKTGSQTICQLMFQVDQNGNLKNESFLKYNGTCRLNNGSQIGIQKEIL